MKFFALAKTLQQSGQESAIAFLRNSLGTVMKIPETAFTWGKQAKKRFLNYSKSSLRLSWESSSLISLGERNPVERFNLVAKNPNHLS
jgi:hypothetical protein